MGGFFLLFGAIRLKNRPFTKLRGKFCAIVLQVCAVVVYLNHAKRTNYQRHRVLHAVH